MPSVPPTTPPLAGLPESEPGPDDQPEDEAIDTEPLAGVTPPHPLDGWTEQQIDAAIASDVTSLGPMSIGRTNAGALVNGVQLPDDPRWHRQDPANTWGTQETVDALVRCIGKVYSSFPDTPVLHLGHISARHGGPLSPHKSHQSGRDVDIGYYYLDGARWYTRATAKNLDRARTWALVRAFIVDSDVEVILIDASIQRLLREYALESGEDADWLEDVFRGGRGRRALITHASGHATHLHVRFYSPIARQTAQRSYSALVRRGLVKPPVYYTHHKVKKGETLAMLAKKYRTTVQDIQRANGLKNTLIRAKRDYKIPHRGGVATSSTPVSVPPRRLPPRGVPRQPSAPPAKP